MAKRNQESDGDATSSAMERRNTVFIDTNLDTHLAMIVSHSDTVLHLKKKFLSEHPKCFPNCGKIKIDALKVKRKGFFYHLSDSMLVKSAFEGAKKCWFLSADASSIKQPDENKMPNKPEATNQLALICFTKATSGDNSNHQAKSSSNKINYLCYPRNYCNEVQKDLEIEVRNGSTDPCSRGFSNFNLESDCTSKKQEELSQRLVALETHIEHREGGSEAGVNDDQCNDPPKASVRSELGVNKKRKSKKKDKTEVSNYTVKDGDMHIDEHSSGMIVTELPKDTKMEHMDACNIVSETNTDNNDGYSQVGIDDNQYNYPLEGSLIRGVVANKKLKSKKKNEVSMSNCTVKDNHLDIDEYSLGKRVREVQVDVQTVNVDAVKGEVEVNIDAVEGPCGSLLDDKGEFLRTHVETQDVESKNLVCNAQGPLEEASKSKPALKKRKTRESKKACDPQEEHNNEKSMINVVVPETSVIVKPKNTTVAENLITEILEHVNWGAAATCSGKRKRKKKISSKDQEVIVEPPSHNPGEERRKEGVEAIAMNADKENAKIVASDMDKASDAAIVSEPNVQLARPSSAIGLGEKEHHDANAEVKSAVPGLGLESGLKGTKKTNKRQSTHVKELPSPAVTEMGNLREDVLSWDEGVRLDNHEVKINGPDKVKEQKELPYNRDKEEMVPEKCEQLQAGEEGKSEEAVGSANLAETNINMEPGKASGSKRLKKRAKKPVSAKAFLSSTECSANTGGDRLSRNEVELLPLIQVNKNKENEEIMHKKLLKETDTSSRVGEKESKMNSLKQNITDITPKNIRDSAAEPRNIKKVDQNSAGETHSALPIKEQEIGVEELRISNYRNEETEYASKTEKKRKSGKTSSKNQSIGKHLEPKKSIGNEIGSLTSAVDAAQPPLSGTHNGNSIDRPLEFVNGDVLNNLNVNDANPQEDVLKSKGDGINFKDYLSPRESDREAPPVEPVVNAVKKLKSSDMGVKAKKKILVSFENGSERKSHPKKFTGTEHKDTKRSTLSSKKETEQKASWSNNRSTFAKSSGKGMGEVMNISRCEKSLLATPASIFWDYSFESSEDTDSCKNGQSDNSSSSSDSEEENESILDPARNGVDGALGANDGRSKKETKTPFSKRTSMDVILRSSSRFKKAKLSAAQSQLEDTENQAVDNDIDLDSQPNQ